MTPGQAARKHLYGLLNGVATFYNELAPQGSAYPHIIATELGPEAEANGMGEPGAHTFLKRIRAAVEGQKMPSELADEIYVALSQATSQQGDWQVFSRFIRDYESAVTDGGKQYRQEGGDYELLVRPIPAPEEG